LRYVERNPLRANLVTRPDAWRRSSLGRAARHDLPCTIIADWPLTHRANWLDLVAWPQTEAEMAALRRSINRGCPYGDADWTITTAKSLGLESAMRSRGRLKQNWWSFESTGLSATCANYLELVAGHLFVGPMDFGQPGRLAAVPSVV